MRWLGILMFGAGVFGMSYAYSKRFMEWLRFQSIGTRDYIVERLGMMFIEVEPNKALIGMALVAFVPGTIAFLAFLPNLIPGIMFGVLLAVVGWRAPKPIVDYMYNKRCSLFVIQMIDALGLMSNGLKSGLSVVQSLGLVAEQMPNPIQQEFNLVLSENKLGVALEDAFNNLAKRIKADDVEMFVTSVNILKETGGNLAETFDTIVSTLRERIKIQNKIEALTSQGKYQGYIVMMVPPVLGMVFYQTDPDFMRPLFTTAIGWVIVFVIFLLEAIGYFVIMKIVAIDV